MIRFIIFLTRKFKLIDRYIAGLVFAYVAINKNECIDSKEIKKLAERRAQEDLKKIVAYEKLGVSSGFGKPIIVRAGRK